MAETLRETLESMRTRFRPGTVDRTITYYFSLGEGEAEKWSVTVGPTSCDLIPGKIDKADCVLKTSADLFTKMVTGKHKPGPMDFVSGKIKTSDVNLLMTLRQAFGF